MNHDKMSNISAKRGFLWPSFEIYSGVSGFTDYGPLGASLKNNIMQKWRKQYVSGEGFYEIEAPTVMPRNTLKASGHVDNFTDPMTKCKIVQSNMDIQDIILECDFNGYGEARSRDEFFGIKTETEDLPFC